MLITSVWFALTHYSVQGLPGVEQAMITGLVFGAIFAVTGRIFTLMVVHAAFDLTALAMIYLDVESRSSILDGKQHLPSRQAMQPARWPAYGLAGRDRG